MCVDPNNAVTVGQSAVTVQIADAVAAIILWSEEFSTGNTVAKLAV